MKTTNQPTSHLRCVRKVSALAAVAMAITACGGGGGPSDPDFTRLCTSGAEASNGVCAAPNTEPACTRDNLTGLVWEARASLAQLSTSAPLDGLCGVANWRKPTVHEMLTLDHAGNGNATSIDRAFFPDLTGGDPVLASGEIYLDGTSQPWAVRFNGSMFVGKLAGPDNPPVRWLSGRTLPVAASNVKDIQLTDGYLATNLSAQAPVVVQRGSLMWLIPTSGSPKSFAEVTSELSAINRLLPDLTNWRLPTRLELDTLVDRTKTTPATHLDLTWIRSDSYWSSSSATNGQAWVVDFNYGDISEQSKTSAARAIYVRR